MHILPLEDRMPGYDHLYQKVASWASVYTRFSLLPDPHALTVVDSCRDRHSDLLTVGGISCTAAVRTFLTDNLAGSVTVRTGLDILDHSKEGLLCIDNLTLALTFRAGLR